MEFLHCGLNSTFMESATAPLDQPSSATIPAPVYASFWQRFAASVMDSVLLVFIASSMRWVLADQLRLFAEGRMDYEESQEMAYIIWSVQLILIRWCYFAGMESSPLKATLGKWLVGIQVVNEQNRRITFGPATGRFFAKIISGLILYIGYIMAAFSYRKQALHDQMAKTYVIQRPSVED